MKLDPFLARIAYDGPLRVDVATLAALQRAFLLAVPFENLSIAWGESITLDVDRHYAKIVERGRGGFCYEVNDLFAWALRQIGFRVSPLGAAVWAVRDGEEGYGDPASHLLLRVDLDEPWIADVGFGENFRSPLPLVDGFCRVEDARAYRLDRRDADGVDEWTLSTRDPEGAWSPTYRFADVVRPMTYFAAMCRFHQTSPLSPFTRKRLCSLATADGRLTLSGNEWIVAGLDGSRQVTTVEDDAEAVDLLRRHFAIDASTPAGASQPETRP